MKERGEKEIESGMQRGRGREGGDGERRGREEREGGDREPGEG